MIRDICKFFNVPPSVADEQDVSLCMNIMQMDTYRELRSRIERGDKLTAQEWKLVDDFEEGTVETEHERGQLAGQLRAVGLRLSGTSPADAPSGAR